MKEFTTKWKASRKPNKQRKYLAKAGLKIRHNIMSAHLSKELRTKYKRRSFPVRKGDTAMVMVGKFKKKSGKIDRVDLKKMKLTIEGIQLTKKDGTKINAVFVPSNLKLTQLNLEDKERVNALERNIKNKEKI